MPTSLSLELRLIQRGLSDVVPVRISAGALKSPWVIQPVFGDFSVLSPSWLWVVMRLLGTAVVAVLLLGASHGAAAHVRRTPAWRSASGGVHGEDQYTPFGYAHPTRRVLAAVLRTRSSVTTPPARDQDTPTPVTTAATSGPVGYSADVVEVVEAYLYRPLRRSLRALSATAKRLQCGRLDAYLAYMLICLVALLAVLKGLA
ncbi:hypothetical protein ACWEQ8_07545 [Streptomyces noursei]